MSRSLWCMSRIELMPTSLDRHLAQGAQGETAEPMSQLVSGL